MSSKSSNLLKYQRINLLEDDTRVIDYNERIAERIAALSRDLEASLEEESPEEFAEGFTDGLNAEQVSALLDEDSNIVKAEPVYNGPSPEELIAEAQEKIDAMYAEAEAEAEQIKSRAYEEGSAKGYQEGAAKAQQEIQSEKTKLEREYEEKEAQLTEVYRQKLEEIEPELMDVLTDIYEHVFGVSISDYREVILHLIGNALHKIEGSSEYLIHVSSEDFPFVSMQKDALLEAGGITTATVEFIEDVTMKKNQCLIETDGGIFDCSLGIELKELKKQLMLLSYDGVQRS